MAVDEATNGEWLNSFLVVVDARHGSTKMVLLAAGSFRGRLVCGSGVASLLLSMEGLRKRKGSEVKDGFSVFFLSKGQGQNQRGDRVAFGK
jgi:hypothetical protein